MLFTEFTVLGNGEPVEEVLVLFCGLQIKEGLKHGLVEALPKAARTRVEDDLPVVLNYVLNQQGLIDIIAAVLNKARKEAR